MRTMADVVDMLEARESPSSPRLGVYDELAPLYDFIHERKFDYEATAAAVVEHAPTEAEAICVGACGTGLLLPHVDTQFETVVGLDASPAMLELAARRTDATLVLADLRNCIAPAAFDVVTILGNSVTLLTPDRGEPDPLGRVLGTVFESLRPGGILVCDFMGAETVRDGEVVKSISESERFRVSESATTTVTDADGHALGPVGTIAIDYDVLDRQRNTQVRTRTAVDVWGLHPGGVMQRALTVGYTEVALVRPAHTLRLVARRPD